MLEQAVQQVSELFEKPPLDFTVRPVNDEEKQDILFEAMDRVSWATIDEQAKVIKVHGDVPFQGLRHEVVHGFHYWYNDSVRVNATLNDVLDVAEKGILTVNEETLHQALMYLVGQEALAYSHDKYQALMSGEPFRVRENGITNLLVVGKYQEGRDERQQWYELLKKGESAFPTINHEQPVKQRVQNAYHFGLEFGASLVDDQPSFNVLVRKEENKMMAVIVMKYTQLPLEEGLSRLQRYFAMDIFELGAMAVQRSEEEKAAVVAYIETLKP